MKFTVETEPFRRMLEMLAQARPGRRRRYAPLRLDASRGRLRVQQDQLAAEIEAVVWQDGRCAVSPYRLLQAVENCGQPALLLEIQDERLRIGEWFVPCVNDPLSLSAPATSRIFFASALGMVSSPVREATFAVA